MAADWIKMRAGLGLHPQLFFMARRLGVTPEFLIAKLYELACWFGAQGDYGKMKSPPKVIDSFCAVAGLSEELLGADWLRDHDGTLCLNWFCSVSTSRKSLGRKVRRQVLSGGVCVICGSCGPLVIDHIIPIARGGSCEIENLQALCWACNSKKGTQTMDEFMAGGTA